jgi:membrane dipeptidase
VSALEQAALEVAGITETTIALDPSALHADALVWDDHSGFEPSPHADLDQLARWRASGVDYLSVNVGYDVMTWQATIRTLADFRRRISLRPDRYLLVETVDDVLRAKSAGLLGITFDLEGMNALNDDLAMVAFYHRLGVRQMLFAYNLDNSAGGGCHGADVGITPFGRAVVAEMNRVGMVVDVSHCGHRTSMEAFEASARPVIFSHSNPWALVQRGRNARDEALRGCAATGGVIGINGIGHFMDDREARSESIFRAIDYVVDLVGPEHVGIGLDYPFPVNGLDIDGLLRRHPEFWPVSEGYGTGLYRNAEPEQFPELTALMIRAGYPEPAIRGALGENFLRIARQVWPGMPSAAAG